MDKLEKIPKIKHKDIKPYDLLDNEQLRYKRANTSGKHEELYVLDIQSLLGRILCNQDYRIWPRFCKFSKSQYFETIHCICVEGYSSTSLLHSSIYDGNKRRYRIAKRLLGTEFEFVDSMSYGIHWRTELFEIPGEFTTDIIRLSNDLSLNFKDVKEKIGESCKRKLFDLKRSSNYKLELLKNSLDIRDPNSNLNKVNYDDEKDAFSRTKLILTRKEMIKENIPLDGVNDLPEHVHLRSVEEYSPVTDTSPMYAIDCEMVDGRVSETSKAVKCLAAISIVDERRQVVYKSYVKPTEYIVNYLTQYSGITAELLEHVETTLVDIQNAMRNLLPLDAILVGHSISNDLDALKIYYPYVIDTSTIFNLRSKYQKDKLKQLTKFFLNRKIQTCRKKGHDSEEDAIATMDLVKLKLGQHINFGLYDTVSLNLDLNGDIPPEDQVYENGDIYPIATQNPAYIRHRENLEALTNSHGSIHLLDYYLNCMDCPVTTQEFKSDINELNGSRRSSKYNAIWNNNWFKESHGQFCEDQKEKRNSDCRKQRILHPINFTVIDNSELECDVPPSTRWLNKLYRKIVKEWRLLPNNSLMMLFTVNCRPGMEATAHVNYGIKLLNWPMDGDENDDSSDMSDDRDDENEFPSWIE